MVTVSAVGDVRVYRDDPDSLFEHVRDHIKAIDIAFCQSEAPYSDKGSMGSSGPRGATTRDPSGYPALVSAGFNVISMASNHMMDWGRDALVDTLDRMHSDGIQTIGAGQDIDEARKPALFEREGTTIAFLGYCSVAPKGYYAVPGHAGVAPMRAITHYEALEDDQPGTPCQILTWPLQVDLDALEKDVIAAKQQADIVIVSLHWGIHHLRALIADYQPVVAHAAINAGADVILGHHQHILKGVEVYQGKVIFYGLGNFASDGSPLKFDDPYLKPRNTREYRRYGSVTDGRADYGKEDNQMNYSMIAKIDIEAGAVTRVGFLPAVITAEKRPEIAIASSALGQAVCQYLTDVTREADLNGEFLKDGDEFTVVT